ncbi:hypothetical protein BC830DRAFT_1116432 [Chytriomyces sp. MP71]|nr:hypothetical protein BC830DRAFT_1116432 [Chytriomyces sp. MP71]
MYFRKVNLAPETVGRRGLLDLLVLFVCFGLNLAKEIPCQLQGLMACFSFDIYQTCAAAVCFCYFDVWFFVRVMRRSNEDGSRWEVVQLCFHTGLMNAMYLVGCWTYMFAFNNFYTNILWTIGFCIQPLSSIQSVTSPNFLKLFSARAGEINIPSWSEVQVHSGKHVGSTPSRDRMSLSPWDSRSPSISHTRDAPLLPIPGTFHFYLSKFSDRDDREVPKTRNQQQTKTGAMPNSKTRKCETELGNE